MMITDEQHLKVLENKLERLVKSLNSGRWVGDDSRGRLEAYALEWAIEKLGGRVNNAPRV